ncbi:myocardin isoform X1 [Cydia fagiglandana]|uniref:myocardin isoform X1 n=2 Tax=Cydia fagiglandana TaxID=1458189 RepID=UPI002FEE3974
MPVRHRELGDEIAPPEPKRCRHCDESRSSCGGGGGSEGPEGRASWRVTLDHDLVETLSAIYPEWFKPQHRRERSRAASPASPASTTPTSPGTPATSPNDDTFSSGAEEMASRQAGGGEPASSPPRVSPPKVVVDDSPLQPAMGKHKESLKVKLMMRRPINQLVAQGIMPPLKTPPAYFEQSKQLERAKTGDLLKAKIQRRPDRQELERRHILEQESHVDPSLAEKQRMLKKARLADALNDQLSHRPGPLELIKKNILHTEQDIETAVKSGTLAFRATSEGASGRPEHPSSYCGPPEDISPSPSPPCLLSPAPSPAPVQHPAPGKADKNRKKTKHKQQQPKARFKFHEYKGPPNAHKAPSPPDSTETPYELLLQQQQLLLQLMPASPAPSSASIASDSSDAYSAPPPPPPPPTPLHVTLHHVPTRYEDMKVSDLRAECKRRNLRVSGPKPQLISRLRPFLLEKGEEPPRSPASVASVASVASPESRSEPEPAEDIVQSQRRQIEELERKLEASRQQLEAVRREAAGAAASDQSRRLLQAHLCVTQLRAQLDALQQPAAPAAAPPPAAPAAPPPRYVLATADAAPDRLVRLFTVAQPAAADAVDPTAAKTANYILNGVKVVPIAILPSPHYEPERAAAPPPPPPPPPMPLPTLHDRNEDMDDVIELLVENGELPPSVVGAAEAQPMRTEFLSDSADAFSPAEVLGDGRTRDSLAADELQRELNDIQNEIMNHADLHAVNGNRCDIDSTTADIDPELNVDLLTNNDFHPDFSSDPTSGDHDDFFGLLSGETDHADETSQTAMDIGEDPPERMAMTPLTNGDILDHTRAGFEDMDDLSLPSFQEDMIQERPCEFDLKEFGIDIGSNMTVDGDAYDYMDTELIPNLFGRGHVPQRDPLLGAVLSRPPPRPARKHYSWDRIEYDAT